MKLFILHIILFFAGNVAAQIPSYTHYETSDGIASNEIYSLKQDKQGFLWIGTDAGLMRYDGNSFQLFTCSKSRGNAMNNLAEDKQGRIWCTNFSGQVFYFNKDTLHLFEPFEKQYSKGFAEICIDPNNQLYVTNQKNYLFKYNLDNKKEERLFANDIYKTNPAVAKKRFGKKLLHLF